MPKLTGIVISSDTKLYWGRPAGYRKMWSFALRWHPVAHMLHHLSISWAACSVLIPYGIFNWVHAGCGTRSEWTCQSRFRCRCSRSPDPERRSSARSTSTVDRASTSTCRPRPWLRCGAPRMLSWPVRQRRCPSCSESNPARLSVIRLVPYQCPYSKMTSWCGRFHSHRASQRRWSRRTIPNEHGRRQDCGVDFIDLYLIFSVDFNKMTSKWLFAAKFVGENLLASRRLQTLLFLLFWLDVRSLVNI